MSSPPHLRILHVISDLSPGGAEKVVLDLAGRQTSAGHQATILSPVDLKTAQVRPTPAGVCMMFLSATPLGRIAKYWTIWRFIRQNRTLIDAQDVIHLHLTMGAIFGFLYRIIARHAGPIVVETNHSAGMPMNQHLRRIRRWMAKRFDAVALVVEDDFWRDPKALNTIPVRLIANGMDPAVYQAVPRGLKAYGGAPVIGTVGMFREDRTPWVFVDIFAQIARQSKSAGHAVPRFLMVGDGPLLDDVRNRMIKAGLEDMVTFHGVSSFPAEQAATMDIFISLNVGPLTGMAAIEASFTGTPLVGYQMDPEYVADEGDWIWSSSDPERLAAHVVSILGDTALYDAVKEAQQTHANAHHSLNMVHEKYRDLYQEAKARKGMPT
jgi:glycosyltransferase involved in cell wall biosynthesis